MENCRGMQPRVTTYRRFSLDPHQGNFNDKTPETGVLSPRYIKIINRSTVDSFASFFFFLVLLRPNRFYVFFFYAIIKVKGKGF